MNDPANLAAVLARLDTQDNILARLDTRTERLDAPAPRWLSVAGAAAYSSLSEKSIRRLIGMGRLTPRRVLRGKLLVDRHEIDSVIGSAAPVAMRK
ncbi:MAG: hypothetical protein WDZ59_11765 [Pirellulales bacterium]